MFNTVVGTYSHVLYGYSVRPSVDQTLVMKPIFIYKAHSACIRTLAARNHFLLSGSDDEAIKIYHLERKRETGTLLQHAGSVGCLRFIQTANKNATKWALSSGEDGKIILWRVHDWEPLLNITAHKPSHTIHYTPLLGPHPSGKLCLSIGPLRELKMWDLTNGKCAFRKKLPNTSRSTPWLVKGQLNEKGREVPVGLEWNPAGTCYSVLFPSHMVTFDATTGESLCQVEDEQLLMHMKYLSNDYIAIAGDAGMISIFGSDGKRVRTVKTAHKLRVKGLDTTPFSAIYPDKTESLPFLISTSSDGTIKIWNSADLCSVDLDDVSPICFVDTKDRITSLAVSYPLTRSVTGKRVREEVSEEEGEDSVEELVVEEEKVQVKAKGKKSKGGKRAKKAKVCVTFE